MAIYIDIGLSAILLLSLIIGLIKGFAKQFTKGFCGLIGFVGAAALTLLIVPALHKAGTLNGFANAAAGWFKDEAFTTSVSGAEELASVMSGGVLKILSGLAPRMWLSMESMQLSTLGALFGDICARFIVGFVIWLILLLLIKFAFFGVKKLLDKLAQLPVLHTLDRVFGAIWSFGISLIFIFLIISAVEIVIVKWVPGAQPELQNLVSNSSVYQILHNLNLLGGYIGQLVGVDLSTLSPII